MSKKWKKPLLIDFFIPLNPHPGSFGFQRSLYKHTGVDLYCDEREPVFAVEDGVVVHSGIFTGPEGYWEDTWAVMVEGASGVVCYGEVYDESWENGEIIKANQQIGRVKRVLKYGKERPDVPHHRLSMLHLELWKPGTKEFKDFCDDILDPTPYLLECKKEH